MESSIVVSICLKNEIITIRFRRLNLAQWPTKDINNMAGCCDSEFEPIYIIRSATRRNVNMMNKACDTFPFDNEFTVQLKHTCIWKYL